MILYKILNHWEDYDEKKRKNGLDPLIFLYDESWEIYYLKGKIKNEFPLIDDLIIFEAIEACSIPGKSNREDFVQSVIKTLKLK